MALIVQCVYVCVCVCIAILVWTNPLHPNFLVRADILPGPHKDDARISSVCERVCLGVLSGVGRSK